MTVKKTIQDKLNENNIKMLIYVTLEFKLWLLLFVHPHREHFMAQLQHHFVNPRNKFLNIRIHSRQVLSTAPDSPRD